MQLALLPQELSPETVLAQLQGRRGAANGITARDLVYVITTGSVRPTNADCDRSSRSCAATGTRSAPIPRSAITSPPMRPNWTAPAASCSAAP